MPKTQENLELSEKETFLTDSPQHCRHESNGDHVVTTNTSPNEIDGEKQKKYKASRHGLQWVLETFKKRYCSVVVPKPNNEGICECGRPLDGHGVPLSQLTVKTDIKWEASKHTRYEGTNAFGEIEFHGVGRKTRAKYIRLSSDTEPLNVIKLLLQEWELDIPKLLISVTGGAKAFKLSPKLKQNFTDGLSKVAQSTGAWVITGGTNTGVMKHVGEALQGAQQHLESHLESKKIFCIGIATWGILNDRKILTHCGETVKYHMENSFPTFGACLDNNHTHFLLADHGIINSYGGEIDFRGTLERCIRRLKCESSGIDGVPGVQLVVEGGPNTIRTVYAAISEVPPIPVVLIKGSGRAADLLAYAVSMRYTSGPLFEMADFVENTQLMDMIRKAYPEINSDKWTNIYNDIIDCMLFKYNITVYSLENEGVASIDEAILTALVNARKVRAVDQLNLAMIWDRVDIARTKIFVDQNKWTQSDLEESMKNALYRNKPEFVELLLENGVSMNQYLTVERLEALYNYDFNSNMHRGNALQNIFDRTAVRATTHNSLLPVLLEGKSRNGALISLVDISRLLSRLLGMKIRPDEYVIEKKSSKKVPQRTRYFENPFHELFLWAVLCNMIDMAILLWTHGEEALAKALIAKKLFKELALEADHSHTIEDVVDELQENARIFDDFSVKLLQECSYNNHILALKLVAYSLGNWGEETCLSLAVASNNLNFVAHSCCQALLTSKWTGALQLHGMQAWKILLCFIFPPGILLLRFKTQKQFAQIIMTESEYQQENLEFTYEREESKNKVSSNSFGTRKSKDLTAEMSSNVSSEAQNDRTELNSNHNNNISVIIKGSSMPDNPHETQYEPRLTIKEKVNKFFKAPVTKFWSNVYAYLLFLLLFGFVITTELPEDPFNSEWLLIVMVFTLFTEEIRQVAHSDAPGFVNKIKNWVSQYWNICDAIAITLFFVGFILRMNGATVTGRVIYSIDIIFWIIRLLDIFTVHQQIGPYVVMIGKMTIDTAYFMFILLVFLVAYGVSRYAILNPNEKHSIATFGKIIMIPYFQIYGELFVEYPTTNNNETIFSTKNHFDHIEPLVAVIMSIYLLVANILLLNLLIAIFNNTYSKVQANSNVIWKFQRYNLVQEYSSRPWLPPPLIIFSHMYSLVNCCLFGKMDYVERDRRLKYFPRWKHELVDLMSFEGKCLASFLRKRHTIMFVIPDEKLRMIGEKVDNITMSMRESKRLQHAAHSSLEEQVARLESIIKVHINRRKSAASSGLQRSISDFGETISLAGVRVPPSPVSLPAHTSTASAVKKAALQFREASIDVDSVIGPGSDPKPKRHSESDSQNEGHVHYFTSTVVDKDDDVQDRNSEEEVETKVPKEPVETETSMGAYPALQQRLKSFSFASTVDDVKDRKSSSLPSSPYQTSAAYDNEACNAVDGKNINIEFEDKEVHIMSRSSVYPLTNIKRFPLLDHLVPWERNMPEYKPPTYTAPMVLASPNWADDEYSGNSNDYTFNGADGNVDRKSYLGIYNIVDGLPRNPKGRTGLQGRGLLGRYGPNHKGEYILTRNRKDALIGNDMIDVLTIGGRALPQDAQFDGQLPDNLQKVFSRQTLLSLNLNQQQCEKYMDALNDILDNKQLVYEGYFDNERNTDNAWIETHAFHFHDHRGDIFTKFLLTDKYSHLKLQWVEASLDMNLPDHQKELIEHILKEMDNRNESNV